MFIKKLFSKLFFIVRYFFRHSVCIAFISGDRSITGFLFIFCFTGL